MQEAQVYTADRKISSSLSEICYTGGGGGGGGLGFDVARTGIASVGFVGFPSVGKVSVWMWMNGDSVVGGLLV